MVILKNDGTEPRAIQQPFRKEKIQFVTPMNVIRTALADMQCWLLILWHNDKRLFHEDSSKKDRKTKARARNYKKAGFEVQKMKTLQEEMRGFTPCMLFL